MKYETIALVAQRIKEYRILHKISQEELGKALNLPKQAISKIEKGKRKLNWEEIQAISDFLKEPYEAFIKEDFKFSYYPKNTDGNFPKFAVDFLEDYKRYLDSEEFEQCGYNSAKSFNMELTRVLNDVLLKREKKYDKERYGV